MSAAEQSFPTDPPTSHHVPATGKLLDGAPLVYALATIVSLFWLVNPTAFLTEDAYFYLVAARRFAHGEGQTFSGVFATNGLHPLWLYSLFGWATVCQWVRPASLLSARFVVFPAIVCLFVGARQLLRAAGRLGLSPVVLAGIPTLYVGVLGILGSEGHLLFAAAAWLLARLSSDRAMATDKLSALLGVCAAVVVLARLDSIFWILAFYSWVLATRSPALPLRRVVICAAAFALVLGPYLLSNLVFFGGMVPISGWMKSSFPRLRTVLPPLSLLGAFRGYNNLFGHGPIVFGLISYRSWSRLPARRLIWPLLIGCLGHDLYTSLFASYAEWYWYYVLNVILAALCLACVAQAWLPRWIRPLLAVGIALAGVTGLAALRHRSLLGSVLEFGPTKFLNGIGSSDEVVLVGDTPGYIGFYSKDRIVAADFLTSSRRMFDRISRDENPLRALFRAYQDAGHPFSYVIFDENRWLGASPDWRTLRLFHPKNGHDGEPFGTLPMPPPVLIQPHLVVWDVKGLVF